MARRPDRRDWYLVLKGCLSLLLGYAYAVAPVPHASRTALSTVTDLVPIKVYGLLWIAAGVYCIVAALSARKLAGFAVCVIMPTVWGAAYLICWLNGDPGRGWLFTGIFWSIAGATCCASGLIDPGPVLRRGGR